MFRGHLAFLSNFAPAPITFEGLEYPTVEHAYQSAKTTDPVVRASFLGITAAEAKKRGKTLKLPADWDERKFDLMLTLLREKFRHPELAQRLVNAPSPIVEENYWGDTYWGVCKGEGQNMLGRLLEQVRRELLVEGYRPTTTPTPLPPARGVKGTPEAWKSKVIREEDLQSFLAQFNRPWCVTGHRPGDIQDYNEGRLVRHLQREIAEVAPDVLVVGGAAGVDQAAHKAANALGLPVVLVMPFDGQWQNWPDWAQGKFHDLAATATAIVVLAENPGTDRKLAIHLLHERNGVMVDETQGVIAFWSGKEQGGTFNCLKYARSLKRPEHQAYGNWSTPVRAEVPAMTQFTVDVNGVKVPMQMAARKRNVTLTLRVTATAVHTHLESEDLSRWTTTPATGAFLPDVFTAITAGLTSMRKDTPVVLDVPAVRDVLLKVRGHVEHGFLDRHGKPIPFQENWKALAAVLDGRPITLK